MAKLSMEQLDYNGAKRMMNKAIEMAPDQCEYYVERGHIYLGLEKNKKALDDFKSAMRIDSMNVEPWIGKSLCHMYNQELDSALMVAHIAYILAESQYEQARAGSLLGEVFLSQEEDFKAFEYFSESLQLDTTNNRGFKKAALIAMKQADFDQAESLLLKALRNDSRDLEILINLAYIYNKMEYFRQSLEYSNMALSFDPTQPLARSNRAYAYFHLGETERALEDINLSIRNDKSNPFAYKYKGEILLALDDEQDEACKCFDKAVDLGYDQTNYKDLDELVAIHCSEKEED
ncbi:MAG TPA: tetratricopeptide repeat protein [Cryomorphaceae bacterium]|nr:tetratricopeptide repeat protein [Cryomorphaceae bacterium]